MEVAAAVVADVEVDVAVDAVVVVAEDVAVAGRDPFFVLLFSFISYQHLHLSFFVLFRPTIIH